jgi:GNAT superfamily N-acetyltransferase
MNIPKKEKSSMAPLFSINKPLYKDWGIMDKPEYIVLAFDNNQVIGGARVIKNKKNDYIEHLYVLNNYRGNKVGSRLLEICTIIAYNRKKKFLQLDAVPDEFTVNSYKRLEQFYLDRGFFLHEGKLIKKTTGTINTDTIEEIKYL